MLVDEVVLRIAGGRGGNGARSFRREKFEPRGGPDGGNGGRGGSVVLIADGRRNTLATYRYRPSYRAGAGGHGRGQKRQGRSGEDLCLRVPRGTAAFDHLSGVLIGDLVEEGQRLVVAAGGRGGRGNAVFRTPTNQAPRRAEPGEPAEERELRLELRLLADVGLVGFPNAGKSSFIARVSAARPRIADYPFTTLSPNLGLVRLGEDAELVVADLPGIIPGASEGAGLGLRFLKHLSRTALVVYFVDLSESSGRHPADDFGVLRDEVRNYGGGLAAKPAVVVGNKTDIVAGDDRMRSLERSAADSGLDCFAVSAATGDGCRQLIRELGVRLRDVAGAAESDAPDVPDGGGVAPPAPGPAIHWGGS